MLRNRSYCCQNNTNITDMLTGPVFKTVQIEADFAYILHENAEKRPFPRNPLVSEERMAHKTEGILRVKRIRFVRHPHRRDVCGGTG